MYEDVCYDVPNSASPDVARRWFSSSNETFGAQSRLAKAPPAGGRNDGFPKLCNEDGECYYVFDAESDAEFQELLALASDFIGSSPLDKRVRSSKVCLSKGKSSAFVAKKLQRSDQACHAGIDYRSLSNAASCIGSSIVSGGRLLYEVCRRTRHGTTDTGHLGQQHDQGHPPQRC